MVFLAGWVPGAVGMALAEKRMGKDTVVVVFLGDGALGEGLVYESLNLASLWKAPVLFVVEHNQYAQSAPTRFQMAGTVAGRFAAFGIPHAELNTNDVTVIHESACEAVGRVRASGSPECLILHTYRLSPHSKGDDFRDPAEIAHWRENDPLKLSAAQLEAEVASRIEAECQTRVQQAIEAASAAPFPEASEDNLSEYTYHECSCHDGGLRHQSGTACVDAVRRARPHRRRGFARSVWRCVQNHQRAVNKLP